MPACIGFFTTGDGGLDDLPSEDTTSTTDVERQPISFSDLISDAYPVWLSIGRHADEFWECTYAEICDTLTAYVKAKEDARRTTVYDMFVQMDMLTERIGKMMGDKGEISTLASRYPGWYDADPNEDDDEEEEEVIDWNLLAAQKASMMAWADRQNFRREVKENVSDSRRNQDDTHSGNDEVSSGNEGCAEGSDGDERENGTEWQSDVRNVDETDE